MSIEARIGQPQQQDKTVLLGSDRTHCFGCRGRSLLDGNFVCNMNGVERAVDGEEEQGAPFTNAIEGTGISINAIKGARKVEIDGVWRIAKTIKCDKGKGAITGLFKIPDHQLKNYQ